MKIYIDNLPGKVTEEILREKFEKFGKVTSVTILKDKNGISTNFGFVEMENFSEATSAIQKMNGAELNEQKLHVFQAQADTEAEAKKMFSIKKIPFKSRFTDKDEQDLVLQHFVSLKAQYLKIKELRTRKDDGYQEIYEILEYHFDESKYSRQINNYIEQLLIPLYNDEVLEVELERRAVDAKGALSKDVSQYYAKVSDQKTEKAKKRVVLNRLINDLQWRNEMRKLQRRYNRSIRRRTAITFGMAFIAFIAPVSVINKMTSLIGITIDGVNLFTAFKSGLLGAAFSMLLSLNTRLKQTEFNLNSLKIQRRWSFLTSRMVIGIGGAVILLYFMQADILTGSVFPDILTGSEKKLIERLDPKNYALLVVWCFLAGFSEKFVPNLLTKAEEQASVKQK